MSNAVTISNPARLVLVAPAALPSLAAGVLARHLDIPADLALRRLACVGGPLAEGLPRDNATRLATLLSALGLRVRLEDGSAAPQSPGLDVALQANSGVPLVPLARGLAAVLGRPEDQVARDLALPGGVILRGLPETAIEALRRSLRRIKGLNVALSRPDQAIFDLFARPNGRLTAALMRHLSAIGLQPCLFNGALASGLDHRTLKHVAARFGDSVFGLERAFQRLDLYLGGSGRLTSLDVADFLATRSVRAEGMSPQSPLRIETGLSYIAARQFQIDYDVIGLHTFARLMQPENS